MKYEPPRSVVVCHGNGAAPVPIPDLEPRLLGAGDDLVLQGSGEVAEVVAVAGYAHDQVAMLVGMRLRRWQGTCDFLLQASSVCWY